MDLLVQGELLAGDLLQLAILPGQQLLLGPSQLPVSLLQLVDLLLVPLMLAFLLLQLPLHLLQGTAYMPEVWDCSLRFAGALRGRSRGFPKVGKPDLGV